MSFDFSSMNGAWLMAQKFQPMQWAVPGLIPEGFGLIAAPPKAGKSWLVLLLSLMVASGRPVMGVQTVSRPVMYLALEDSPRRLQDRCKVLLNEQPAPADWHFHTDPDTAEEVVRQFAAKHADALIIVDTLQVMRKDGRKSQQDAYGADYRFARSLKDFCPERGSLLCVHHTRKAEATDFLDMVSGTQGIAGAADFVMVLERGRLQRSAKLHITGRDVYEASYAVAFEDGVWSAEGGDLEKAAARAAERQHGELATAIADFVNHQPATTAAQVVAKFSVTSDAARQQLSRLHRYEKIGKDKAGVYVPLPVTLSQTA